MLDWWINTTITLVTCVMLDRWINTTRIWSSPSQLPRTIPGHPCPPPQPPPPPPHPLPPRLPLCAPFPPPLLHHLFCHRCHWHCYNLPEMKELCPWPLARSVTLLSSCLRGSQCRAVSCPWLLARSVTLLSSCLRGSQCRVVSCPWLLAVDVLGASWLTACCGQSQEGASLIPCFSPVFISVFTVDPFHKVAENQMFTVATWEQKHLELQSPCVYVCVCVCVCKFWAQ